VTNFFVFRTDLDSRTSFWEVIKQKGRLQQGWALAGTSLLDNSGNIQSEDDWIRKCWPAFKRAWKDFTKKGAIERYKILRLMLQIHPGDLVIVPKMPEDDKFVLVRASQNPARIGRDAPCYDFDENPNPQDDFRHQVFVDPDSVREFSWKSLPGSAGEKRLQFYQKAVNQIKDEMLQKEIRGLSNRSEDKRMEPEIVRLDRVAALLRFKRQLILQGPPGTGKTRLAKRLAAEMLKLTAADVEREENDNTGAFANSKFTKVSTSASFANCWDIVQFHPSYNYEDFVRGIRIQTSGTKSPEYKTENRIFGQLAEYALGHKDKSVVLIIDEINRANLGAVLGELIYALEYRGVAVSTPYTPENNQDSSILIPKNLYVIGTMNTADRSIGHIDYAIRRRFAFERISPDASVIEEMYRNKPAQLREEALSLFSDVEDLFFKRSNGHKVEPSEYVSRDFDPLDVQVGHSYFLADDGNTLRMKCRYEVLPILEEYVKDGVLNEKVREKLDPLRKRLESR
jgi:MoxR-like ATPase